MDNVLGSLESIELRKIWPNEARDFTPWLAREENIVKLGDAIGLEIEVEKVEVAVGPYSADILAKDVSTGEYIVIENQIEKTDHDHLGKVITYASVLNAKTVVWIAANFTDEHKKALDWLNDNTSEELSFYGVQVELISIDNSKPACIFNAVSKRSDIVKQAGIAKVEDLTDARKLQMEFWTCFRDELIRKKVVVSARTPQARYWYDMSLGKTGIHLSCICNTSSGIIGLRVYLVTRIVGNVIDQFIEDRDEIEEEIGAKLEWNPHPDKIDKIITLKKSADVNNKAKWPEYIEWLADNAEKFRKAFVPRIKMLVIDKNSRDQENS